MEANLAGATDIVHNLAVIEITEAVALADEIVTDLAFCADILTRTFKAV